MDTDEGGPEAAAEAGRDAGNDVASDAVSPTCLRVFVSSATYTGNLGGASGADSTCQGLASQAGLGASTWKAWISDGTTSPSQRFTKGTLPYCRLDGATVAVSFSALANGISNPIDVDEKGESLASASSDASKTWTGAVTSGAAGTSSCGGFASTTGTGSVGHCTSTGTVGWTSAYTSEMCSVANHIYCFEQ